MRLLVDKKMALPCTKCLLLLKKELFMCALKRFILDLVD
jgi:hypothetical protein